MPDSKFQCEMQLGQNLSQPVRDLQDATRRGADGSINLKLEV